MLSIMIYDRAECMHDTHTVLYDFSMEMEWNGILHGCIKIPHIHFVGRQRGVFWEVRLDFRWMVIEKSV